MKTVDSVIVVLIVVFLIHIFLSFQAVLSVMRQRNVTLNVQTFGCLALGCERQQDGLQLLKDMEVIKTHDSIDIILILYRFLFMV